MFWSVVSLYIFMICAVLFRRYSLQLDNNRYLEGFSRYLKNVDDI